MHSDDVRRRQAQLFVFLSTSSKASCDDEEFQQKKLKKETYGKWFYAFSRELTSSVVGWSDWLDDRMIALFRLLAFTTSVILAVANVEFGTVHYYEIEVARKR